MFEAVQSGEHSVTLLADSLPDGALIAGEATQIATLGRERMTVDVPFVVSLETRAEIRKVFPGSAAAALPKPGAAARRDGKPMPTVPKADAAAAKFDASAARVATPAPTPGTFALQVAAFDDPARARQMVVELKNKGLQPISSNRPPMHRMRLIVFALEPTPADLMRSSQWKRRSDGGVRGVGHSVGSRQSLVVSQSVVGHSSIGLQSKRDEDLVDAGRRVQPDRQPASSEAASTHVATTVDAPAVRGSRCRPFGAGDDRQGAWQLRVDVSDQLDGLAGGDANTS